MNIDNIKSLLLEIPIFKELNDEEIGKVVDISLTREYERNSYVFIQDEPLENVYFIYEGKIKIYRTDINGREQIVSFLKPGEMFPHVGFFRKGNYPAFALVMEKAKLVVVPIRQFEDILLDNPELSMKIFHVLGDRIIDLHQRLEAQILNNTYEQIIKLLIRLGKLHGKKQPNGDFLLKPEFTNKELANMIGTTRETVSRTLTRMKKEGLISVDDDNNFIYDPEQLLDELTH